MREIDTGIFRDIIEDHGCFSPYEEEVEGVLVSHYISKNSNKRVLIITSEEFISEQTAKNHLYDLELSDLIDVMPYQEIFKEATE